MLSQSSNHQGARLVRLVVGGERLSMRSDRQEVFSKHRPRKASATLPRSLVVSCVFISRLALHRADSIRLIRLDFIRILLARQAAAGDAFDPTNVDLDTADPKDIICYLNAGENEYDGRLGARVSAIFVILIVSSAVTFFPVLATRSKKLRVPLYVYLFARYFGTGVIVATAFIQ
jgi:hypothetical protein